MGLNEQFFDPVLQRVRAASARYLAKAKSKSKKAKLRTVLWTELILHDTMARYAPLKSSSFFVPAIVKTMADRRSS